MMIYFRDTVPLLSLCTLLVRGDCTDESIEPLCYRSPVSMVKTITGGHIRSSKKPIFYSKLLDA